MTESTIREALVKAAAGFAKLEAAVCTSFNFHPEFFENNVLPALFGVSSHREGNRRNLVNDRLLETEVCVLYDASTRPKGGGPYRYQRVGVFRAGAFFHPKLMVLAGRHLDDGRPWVYLAVSSANLTLSGWGKNQEVIGEAWIGSQRQVLHSELREALGWLRENAAGVARTPVIAIDRCLAVLDSMGAGSNIGATTGASFYFSPLQPDGFFESLQAGQTGRWDNLTAFSPFWGDVETRTERANCRTISLVPALLVNGMYGLSSGAFPEQDGLELRKLSRMKDARFWHAKIYVLSRGERVRVGVGSANFTGAGLRGGDNGNVEAMLVYEADSAEADALMPKLARLSLDDPQIPERPPDDAPQPAPLQIEVVYDWKARKYFVFFVPAEERGIGDYRLSLPGLEPVALEDKGGSLEIADPRGPVVGSSFRLHYLADGVPMTFDGLINEINVDLGDKPYFRPLSLLEILESWRLPGDSAALTNETSSTGDGVLDEEEHDVGTGGKAEPVPGFDVLNLYEMYRSFHELGKRMQAAADEGSTERLLGYLVTRPDSVYRVARQAAEDPREHPIPRFLLLLECRDVMNAYKKLVPNLDRKVWGDVRSWAERLRETLQGLPSKTPDGATMERVSTWFEDELRRAWRT